jgi:hypothetical protein
VGEDGIAGSLLGVGEGGRDSDMFVCLLVDRSILRGRGMSGAFAQRMKSMRGEEVDSEEWDEETQNLNGHPTSKPVSSQAARDFSHR